MKNTFNTNRKRTWVIFILLFLSISSQAQTIVKVMVNQPEILEIVANELFSQTINTTILGDQVTINGGVSPYQYSWLNEGNILGTSLVLEVPKFTPTNSLTLTVTDANNCSCIRNAILTNIEDINLDKSKMAVYPNPASDFIIIDPREINGILDISIFDNSGVRLLNRQINGKTNININLLSGLYILRIENKNEHTVILKKLIVL